MKTQVRIGYIFSIVAVSTYTLNAVARIVSGSSLASILQLSHLSYLFYAVGFFVSARVNSIAMQGLQIGIVAFEALLCLTMNVGEPFPGICLLIIAALLAYVYGAFARYTKIKILAVFVCIYAIFLELPIVSIDNKYIRSLEWVGFIGGFFATLWIIFKDKIAKLEYNEKHILEVAEEAASIASDAIKLGKECGERKRDE